MSAFNEPSPSTTGPNTNVFAEAAKLAAEAAANAAKYAADAAKSVEPAAKLAAANARSAILAAAANPACAELGRQANKALEVVKESAVYTSALAKRAKDEATKATMIAIAARADARIHKLILNSSMPLLEILNTATGLAMSEANAANPANGKEALELYSLFCLVQSITNFGSCDNPSNLMIGDRDDKTALVKSLTKRALVQSIIDLDKIDDEDCPERTMMDIRCILAGMQKK